MQILDHQHQRLRERLELNQETLDDQLPAEIRCRTNRLHDRIQAGKGINNR